MQSHRHASLTALAAALCLSACTAAAPRAALPPAPPPQAQASSPAPASPQELVAKVAIPYEKFVLDNGLTTIVHTDRKAPIVGVTLYYRVGAKHEPRGRTGFAHLYEHLFFSGSPNAPEFDEPLERIGSSSPNGSTSYDRTNYVVTVPTGALELALFQESDRMGWILPAVTQDKLDKQRGVVQNEKRQYDNQPYALAEYAIGEGLFPVGHPYRHEAIGSMADLNAATLTDVRKWFTDHYAPNNVVLVLSGDIDAATARPLVKKWFGAIPRGPAVQPVKAGPVTMPAPLSRDMADQVPVLRLSRNWSGPGLNDPDTPALEVGLHILGGLASSRLDNELVRGQQLAVSVTASAQAYEDVSVLRAMMNVKPGVDRKQAEAAFDKVIADLLRDGPSEDELRRAVVSTLSAEIGALEEVGSFAGKGATLAEGELYSGDPARFRKDLEAKAALTPVQVRDALRKWLSRPVFTLAVVPGERTEDGALMGGWGDEGVTPPPAPDKRAKAPALAPAPKREAPPVAPVGDLDFPAIEHASLANGVPVSLARRTAVPRVSVSVQFDAGYAADALDTPGTQGLMLRALEEGTANRDAESIAAEQERLGADIAVEGALDTSSVTLTALSPNLAPSLALMADMIRNPAFAEADVERVRMQAQASLAQQLTSPNAMAQRTLYAELFGEHPYALPADGLGNAASLAALDAAKLRAAHAKWLRPDLARITVVGDVTMDELKPLLEQAFGSWTAPASPRPLKPVDHALPPARDRIVLVDRPGSPQSVIMAGRVLPLTGRGGGEQPLDLANDVVGGGFLSRLNEDLREQKGWSYGVYSSITRPVGPRTFVVQAPVQADRTGPAIAAILADLKAFPARAPVTPAELERVTEGSIRSLPIAFESSAEVLNAIERNALLGRPDDYYVKLAGIYRAIDRKAIETAASRYLQPAGMTFVVVGDRKTVEPQLKALGMPLEIREAPAVESAGE